MSNMDFKLLKTNARTSFKRKHVESAFVAFLITLFSGSSSSISYTHTSNNGTATTTFEGYEMWLEELKNIPQEIVAFISMLLAFAFLLTFVLTLFLHPILAVGGSRYFLKLRKNLPTGIGELTGNFKDGNYWNIVKIYFFKNVKLFFWTLLFIIPGVIKSIEYSLVDYILAVRPDLDSKSAFAMSKRLMKGYKADAFLLGLSFIGWYILAIPTFGILNLVYVNPYWYATYAEFYCCVRAKGIMNGIITPMDLPDYENPFYQQAPYNFYNGMEYNPQSQPFNQYYPNPYQQGNPQYYQGGYQQQSNPQYYQGYQQQPNPQYYQGYQQPIMPQFADTQNPTPVINPDEKTE